jgi:hypothetical protein
MRPVIAADRLGKFVAADISASKTLVLFRHTKDTITRMTMDVGMERGVLGPHGTERMVGHCTRADLIVELMRDFKTILVQVGIGKAAVEGRSSGSQCR